MSKKNKIFAILSIAIITFVYIKMAILYNFILDYICYILILCAQCFMFFDVNNIINNPNKIFNYVKIFIANIIFILVLRSKIILEEVYIYLALLLIFVRICISIINYLKKSKMHF